MKYITQPFIVERFGLLGLYILDYIQEKEGVVEADFIELSEKLNYTSHSIVKTFKLMWDNKVVIAKSYRVKETKKKYYEVKINEQFLNN